MNNDLQILQLFRLVSPALPVGAFAYSQGLEGSIEQNWVKNEQDSFEWISGILQNNIVSLDLPALYWQLSSLNAHDLSAFQESNDIIFAFRETAEFRLESHQMGQALLRLLRDTRLEKLEMNQVEILLKPNYFKQVDWVSAFAVAAFSENVNAKQAMLGYAWAWCETQVAAAIKLVPLGQTQGQQLLIKLTDLIVTLIDQLHKEMPSFDEIGAVSPNLSIISSLHETQYSRLFRS